MLEIKPQYENILMHSELFTGISKEELPEALSYLNSEIKEYKKAETIIHLNKTVKPGIILKGEAKISYFDKNMNSMAIDHLTSGEIFGQAAACVDGYKAQVELITVAPTTTLEFDFGPLLIVGGGS